MHVARYRSLVVVGLGALYRHFYILYVRGYSGGYGYLLKKNHGEIVCVPGLPIKLYLVQLAGC